MPSKAAAKKKTRSRAAAPGGKLTVKQSRSSSGRPELHCRTLRALGLRYHQQVITVTDSPAIRGMLHQVRHLVTVTPAGEK